MGVHARAAVVGDDGSKRDDAAVGNIFGEGGVCHNFVEPPDGIGVGIGMAEEELVFFDAAGGEVFGEAFFEPFLEVDIGDFAV